MEFQIIFDRGFQLPCAAVNTPTDLFFRQGRKEALNHVDPRGAGGCKVHLEPRAPRQPTPDQHGFVRPVIVQNQVYVQVRRNGDVDSIEKFTELKRAMPPMTLPDHPARLGIQSCKECCRAIAKVIMAPSFRLSGTHGQHRLRAVQSLNLALFIN